MFLSSYATTWIGIPPIFGAFAFGFVMPREPFAALMALVTTGLAGPLLPNAPVDMNERIAFAAPETQMADTGSPT